MKPEKKFEIAKPTSGETTILVLSGAISEASVFPEESSHKIKMLIMDLAGVTRANSSGIRLWLQWVGALKLHNPTVTMLIRSCPKCIVDLMNSFKDFFPSPFVV